jgi:hypothetical protein
MRSTLILLICALTSLSALAQGPASYAYMTRHKMTCSDIAYSCQALIPDYARQNKTDSLRLVLQFWVDQCNDSERTMRMKILLNLKERTFYEEHYKDTLQGLLTAYRVTVEDNLKESKVHHAGKDSVLFRIRNEFDAFTADFAHEISKQYDQYTLEFLLAEYYSRNFYSLQHALYNNQLPGAYLQERYNEQKVTQRVDDCKTAVHSHVALMCEYWIPGKNASLLGNHMGAGLQLGLRGERFMLDWIILFRFGDATNEYKVYAQDSLKTTKRFSGHYFAAQFGYRIIDFEKAQIDLLTGIGQDGFNAIKKDSAAGVDPKSIGSLAISMGLGYQQPYGHKGNYVGVQALVNAVDYFNKGGTDLNGPTFSLRLIWGFKRSYCR